jgi:2-iminobutanoate/2-iminopropanoate deaminase
MKTVSTPHAPAAIGPYSQAKIAGGFLFTAGQIALIPATMEMRQGGIEAQTEQVLDNLTAVLQGAGSSWERVVKTTVFLTDLSDFAAFNAVYERRLGLAKPARSTVQVAALPRGASVEIELIAEV